MFYPIFNSHRGYKRISFNVYTCLLGRKYDR